MSITSIRQGEFPISITNIKYRDLPVKKLYLGKKLIWQYSKITEMVGNANSLFQTKAYTYVPVLSSISSECSSGSYNKVALHLLEITLMNGECKSHSYDDSTLKLLNVIISSGISIVKTIGTSILNDFEANFLNSQLRTTSDNLVICRVNIAELISSKTNLVSNQMSPVSVNRLEKINGQNASNITISSTTQCTEMLKVNTNTISSLAVKPPIMYCWILMKINTNSQSFSNTNAIGRIANLELISGNAVSNTMVEGLCKLSDVLYLCGDAYSESSTQALMIYNDSTLLKSRSENLFIGTGYINKDTVLICKTNTESKSVVDGSAILVYPPIGDNIVLSTGDDIDITINGNILEIRQAYSINIDNENKTLEVV